MGSFVFRHVLPLEAPIDVHFDMHHGGDQDSVVPLGMLVLTICDDGAESYIGVADSGKMLVLDVKTDKRVITADTSAATKYIGKNMAFELHHDGQTARFSHDGILDAEQPAGARKAGDVVLMIHSSRLIALDSLTLRGKLGAAGKKKLRDLWIASKVKQLGV
jgi:hypothetical protein